MTNQYLNDKDNRVISTSTIHQTKANYLNDYALNCTELNTMYIILWVN